MKYLRTTALLITVLVVSHAYAQNPPTSRDSLSQKGDPTAERAKLQFLVGSFTTETIMPERSPSAKRTTTSGTSVIAWALDSAFLLIDDQSSLFGKYKAHGVLGYDPQTHQFVLSMFNNFGDHPSYSGNFVGDTLVLETRIPMQGMSFDQKLLWYKDGEVVTLRVLNDLGNGFVPTLEQTATPSSVKSK